MSTIIRKPGIHLLVGMLALTWAVLCVGWLFFGSGYQFIHPTAYELTTRTLLSFPETAAEASEVIQAKGYLSIIEQNRLLTKISR